MITEEAKLPSILADILSNCASDEERAAQEQRVRIIYKGLFDRLHAHGSADVNELLGVLESLNEGLINIENNEGFNYKKKLTYTRALTRNLIEALRSSLRAEGGQGVDSSIRVLRDFEHKLSVESFVIGLLGVINKRRLDNLGQGFYELKLDAYVQVKTEATIEVLADRISTITNLLVKYEAIHSVEQQRVLPSYFLRWKIRCDHFLLRAAVEKIAAFNRIEPLTAIWRFKKLASDADAQRKIKFLRLLEVLIAKVDDAIERFGLSCKRRFFNLLGVRMFSHRVSVDGRSRTRHTSIVTNVSEFNNSMIHRFNTDRREDSRRMVDGLKKNIRKGALVRSIITFVDYLKDLKAKKGENHAIGALKELLLLRLGQSLQRKVRLSLLIMRERERSSLKKANRALKTIKQFLKYKQRRFFVSLYRNAWAFRNKAQYEKSVHMLEEKDSRGQARNYERTEKLSNYKKYAVLKLILAVSRIFDRKTDIIMKVWINNAVFQRLLGQYRVFTGLYKRNLHMSMIGKLVFTMTAKANVAMIRLLRNRTSAKAKEELTRLGYGDNYSLGDMNLWESDESIIDCSEGFGVLSGHDIEDAKRRHQVQEMFRLLRQQSKTQVSGFVKARAVERLVQATNKKFCMCFVDLLALKSEMLSREMKRMFLGKAIDTIEASNQAMVQVVSSRTIAQTRMKVKSKQEAIAVKRLGTMLTHKKRSALRNIRTPKYKAVDTEPTIVDLYTQLRSKFLADLLKLYLNAKDITRSRRYRAFVYRYMSKTLSNNMGVHAAVRPIPHNRYKEAKNKSDVILYNANKRMQKTSKGLYRNKTKAIKFMRGFRWLINVVDICAVDRLARAFWRMAKQTNKALFARSILQTIAINYRCKKSKVMMLLVENKRSLENKFSLQYQLGALRAIKSLCEAQKAKVKLGVAAMKARRQEFRQLDYEVMLKTRSWGLLVSKIAYAHERKANACLRDFKLNFRTKVARYKVYNRLVALLAVTCDGKRHEAMSKLRYPDSSKQFKLSAIKLISKHFGNVEDKQKKYFLTLIKPLSAGYKVNKLKAIADMVQKKVSVLKSVALLKIETASRIGEYSGAPIVGLVRYFKRKDVGQLHELLRMCLAKLLGLRGSSSSLYTFEANKLAKALRILQFYEIRTRLKKKRLLSRIEISKTVLTFNQAKAGHLVIRRALGADNRKNLLATSNSLKNKKQMLVDYLNRLVSSVARIKQMSVNLTAQSYSETTTYSMIDLQATIADCIEDLDANRVHNNMSLFSSHKRSYRVSPTLSISSRNLIREDRKMSDREEDLRERLARLSVEKANLEQVLNEIQREREEYEDLLNQEEDDLEKIEYDLEELLEAKERLDKEFLKIETKCNNFMQENEAMEENVGDLVDALKQLQADIQELCETIERLKTIRGEKAQQLESYEGTRTEVQAQEVDLAHDLTDLETMNAISIKALSDEIGLYNSCMNEITALRQQKIDINIEVQKVDNELRAVNFKLVSISLNKSELGAENKFLSEQQKNLKIPVSQSMEEGSRRKVSALRLSAQAEEMNAMLTKLQVIDTNMGSNSLVIEQHETERQRLDARTMALNAELDRYKLLTEENSSKLKQLEVQATLHKTRVGELEEAVEANDKQLLVLLEKKRALLQDVNVETAEVEEMREELKEVDIDVAIKEEELAAKTDLLAQLKAELDFVSKRMTDNNELLKDLYTKRQSAGESSQLSEDRIANMTKTKFRLTHHYEEVKIKIIEANKRGLEVGNHLFQKENEIEEIRSKLGQEKVMGNSFVVSLPNQPNTHSSFMGYNYNQEEAVSNADHSIANFLAKNAMTKAMKVPTRDRLKVVQQTRIVSQERVATITKAVSLRNLQRLIDKVEDEVEDIEAREQEKAGMLVETQTELMRTEQDLRDQEALLKRNFDELISTKARAAQLGGLMDELKRLRKVNKLTSTYIPIIKQKKREGIDRHKMAISFFKNLQAATYFLSKLIDRENLKLRDQVFYQLKPVTLGYTDTAITQTHRFLVRKVESQSKREKQSVLEHFTKIVEANRRRNIRAAFQPFKLLTGMSRHRRHLSATLRWKTYLLNKYVLQTTNKKSVSKGKMIALLTELVHKRLYKAFHSVFDITNTKKLKLLNQRFHPLVLKGERLYKDKLRDMLRAWYVRRTENKWFYRIFKNVVLKSSLSPQIAFWRMVMYKPTLRVVDPQLKIKIHRLHDLIRWLEESRVSDALWAIEKHTLKLDGSLRFDSVGSKGNRIAEEPSRESNIQSSVQFSTESARDEQNSEANLYDTDYDKRLSIDQSKKAFVSLFISYIKRVKISYFHKLMYFYLKNQRQNPSNEPSTRLHRLETYVKESHEPHRDELPLEELTSTVRFLIDENVKIKSEIDNQDNNIDTLKRDMEQSSDQLTFLKHHFVFRYILRVDRTMQKHDKKLMASAFGAVLARAKRGAPFK